MTDAIDTLLTRVRMTAGHLAPVLLTPTEASALVAEVERLRVEVDLLQREAIIRRAINDGLTAAVAEERAAVVAWLREDERMHEMHGSRFVASSLRHLCEIIELGEHRREEE